MTTTKRKHSTTPKAKKSAKRPRKPLSRMSARELRELATFRREMESARDRLGSHVLALLDAVDAALEARRRGAQAIELAQQLEAAAVVVSGGAS